MPYPISFVLLSVINASVRLGNGCQNFTLTAVLSVYSVEQPFGSRNELQFFVKMIYLFNGSPHSIIIFGILLSIERCGFHMAKLNDAALKISQSSVPKYIFHSFIFYVTYTHTHSTVCASSGVGRSAFSSIRLTALSGTASDLLVFLDSLVSQSVSR